MNGPQPHYQVWTNKATNEKWTFIRDERRFGRSNWVIDIESGSYRQVLAGFYQPNRIGNREPSVEEAKLIADAKFDHHRLGHPHDEVFKMQIANLPDMVATVRGLELWREIYGDCTGCIADANRHPKLPSSKPIVCEPGEVIAGDIMFLDTEAKKQPALLLVDVGSKCPVFEELSGRTLGAVKTAMTAAHMFWPRYGHKPKQLLFDREKAIMAAKQWAEVSFQLEMKPTAAGQKQPIAEVNIRIVKSVARRLRAGVRDRFGYEFPWRRYLYRHAVRVVQRTPKRGEIKSPWEKFTNSTIDWKRDFRCELGEPIYVEKPKQGAYTGSEDKAELGIFVENPMNGTGVLGVYLLKTKRIVFRLQFERGEIPDWGREALQALKYELVEPEFLDDPGDVPSEEYERARVESQLSRPPRVDDIPASSDRGGTTAEGVGDSVDQAESDGAAEPLQPEENDTGEENPIGEVREPVEGEAHQSEPEGPLSDQPTNVGDEPVESVHSERPQQPSHGYGLRSREGRRNYRDLLAHYRSVGVTFGKPMLRVLDTVPLDPQDPEYDSDFVNYLHVLQITFKEALKTENAQSARESMIKELKQALRFKAFHGVKFSELSEEERGRILRSTSLVVQKYFPTGEFEKFKSRFLVRGDMQKPEFTASTSSPVVRHETVMWFLAIAVYCRMKRVKIDFVGAYLNTPRPAEVKYKHVWIPADIAAILIELEPAFKEFLQPDGRILVEMDKLFYGYKEAARYWFLLLVGVLLKHGFKQSYWDQCCLYLFSDEYEIILVLCVDDVLAGSTTDQGLAFLISICEQEFEGGITVQEGDIITHLGMVLDFTEPGAVKISADKAVKDLLEYTDEWKKHQRFARTPMSPTYQDSERVAPDEFLDDQKRELYHSIVMLVMYIAKKCWPTILYSACVLSGVVRAPKEFHWKALMRVLAYVARYKDHYKLVIKPSSLNVVCSADASYLAHSDLKGHTGGCVGVRGAEGQSDCYFVFIGHKQSLVTKSVKESEVVAQDDTVDYAVWSEGLRDDLVPPSILKDLAVSAAVVQGKSTAESKEDFDHFETTQMQSDNQAAVISLHRGRGSFQRCKHIEKRFFWMTELLSDGRLSLKWIPGDQMPADLLTKAVTEEVHDYLLPMLTGSTAI